MADVIQLNMLIDWSFIEESEGKEILEGYVPYSGGSYKGKELPDPKKLLFNSTNQSGVTIATGFDLGQHTEAQIRGMLVLDSNLADRLAKFANKKRIDACKALYEAKGLKIDGDQAKDIDRAVKRKKMARFMEVYNLVAVTKLGKMPFENLHYQLRTAIMDFAFQYGENGNWHGPTASKYWKAITSQDFPEARRILLEEYKTQFVHRRRREAELYGKAGIVLISETIKYKN